MKTTADQAPSDAEVEALIQRLAGPTTGGVMEVMHKRDLDCLAAAPILRALLNERQATRRDTEARIAAAVQDAVQQAIDAIDAVEPTHRRRIARKDIRATIAAIRQDTADHLATRLAEAEARGLRMAADVEASEIEAACRATRPDWSTLSEAYRHIQRGVMKIALKAAKAERMKTHPAGGASDAG